MNDPERRTYDLVFRDGDECKRHEAHYAHQLEVDAGAATLSLVRYLANGAKQTVATVPLGGLIYCGSQEDRLKPPDGSAEPPWSTSPPPSWTPPERP